jgi:hypothetical protein
LGKYLNGGAKMGPNVRKLHAEMLARVAIPNGGGLADGLALFTTPGRFQEVARQAMEQVETALEAMKSAPDNPYGDDDEVIAGAMLQAIEERRQGKR